MIEAGLEEGLDGSSGGLGHPPYFSSDSAVQLSQLFPFPCGYCPLLTALFPIVYSLASYFCHQPQK